LKKTRWLLVSIPNTNTRHHGCRETNLGGGGRGGQQNRRSRSSAHRCGS
jgi:hypothetical protein